MRIFIIVLFQACFLSACIHSPSFSQGKTSSENTETVVITDSVSKPNVDTLVADTAAYIKSLVSNKSKYIDKPFGLLLNDLKLPPKSYFIGSSFYNVNIVPDIEIHFDDKRTTSRKIANIDRLDNPVQLQIIWKKPVSSTQASEVLQKSTSPGNWQAAEKDFYSKQIAGDIKYFYNKR